MVTWTGACITWPSTQFVRLIQSYLSLWLLRSAILLGMRSFPVALATTCTPNTFPTYPKVAGVKELIHQPVETNSSNSIVLSTVLEHFLFDKAKNTAYDWQGLGEMWILHQKLQMPGEREREREKKYTRLVGTWFPLHMLTPSSYRQAPQQIALQTHQWCTVTWERACVELPGPLQSVQRERETLASLES